MKTAHCSDTSVVSFRWVWGVHHEADQPPDHRAARGARLHRLQEGDRDAGLQPLLLWLLYSGVQRWSVQPARSVFDTTGSCRGEVILMQTFICSNLKQSASWCYNISMWRDTDTGGLIIYSPRDLDFHNGLTRCLCQKRISIFCFFPMIIIFNPHFSSSPVPPLHSSCRLYR